MSGPEVGADRGRHGDPLEIQLGQRFADDAGLLEGSELGIHEHHQDALDPAKAPLTGERMLEALDPDVHAGQRGHIAKRADGLLGTHPRIVADCRVSPPGKPVPGVPCCVMS